MVSAAAEAAIASAKTLLQRAKGSKVNAGKPESREFIENPFHLIRLRSRDGMDGNADSPAPVPGAPSPKLTPD